MTTAKNGISHLRTHIQQFTATKQLELFESLKEARFSGQLVISDTQNHTWILYMYLGRIMYASGGVHPVRRWRRHIVAYCPERLSQIEEIQLTLANIAQEESRISWEYQLLSLWIDQNKISSEQATKVIRATIVEVLFDVTQAMEVTYEPIKDNLLSTRLILIDAEQAIVEANKLYSDWQEAKVADRSPDMSPIIRQPEALQQKTSAQVYQNLRQLLDGKQTLRDLSVRMKRDVVTVTRSLLPYIQLGLVQLISIGDIAPPASTPIAKKLTTTKALNRSTIACIDDSPIICQTMESIITGAGYQFVAEMDGLRAIAILLSRKPDLIFLDLVMPNTNGYEICSQLRKLSFFKTTPIVILTGNDGIVDRVRAKMVGSTDFLAKPAKPEQVLATINKYITQTKKI
ncbi:response regulator [Pleurocapsa sp. PCC 7319]|uniref:response regulator n=1 Tax=Pleurocapsa sp. PCC 7319 TaxID=118161 RepID=UPI000348CF33|nr:response regulator [Pleurocapsa sp. PCC 7319]